MPCPSCLGELESGAREIYMRCMNCHSLFIHTNDALTPYHIADESMRAGMEMALGFSPSVQENFEAPDACTQCQGLLEKVASGQTTLTRCQKCGLLSELQGRFLIPIVVSAPAGGWDPEFQSIFESKLGFSKRLRRVPPGVVGA